MSNLTPNESAALRARIIEGADGLSPRGHGASRMVAIATSIVVVGAVSAGAVAVALGFGTTTDTLATPSPTASVTGTPSPSPTATAAPSPSLTPTPTVAPPAPPVVLEPGQNVVTEQEWNLLTERGWGYYYFQAADRYVAVDPTRDFPEEVTADIQQRIDAIPNNTLDQNDTTTSLSATYDLMIEVRGNARKEIVTLRYNPFSVPGEPNELAIRWFASSSQQGWSMPLSKNRDQLLADVNAWVAANTAPESWAVFVGPGEPIIP